MDCVKHSDKLLLLTATPYVNNLGDFNALINLLGKEVFLKMKGEGYITKTFNEKNLTKLIKYLNNKVSFAIKRKWIKIFLL